MNTTDKQIAELEAKLAHLREVKRLQDLLSPLEALAIALHDQHCRWNHTDGCGWHYEITNGVHQWSGCEHRVWIGKAHQLLLEIKRVNITVDDCLKLLKIANG